MNSYKYHIIWIISLICTINSYCQNKSKLNSLENIINTTKDAKIKIDAYNEASVEYKKINTTKSLLYAEKALELARLNDYPAGLCDGLYNKALVKVILGELDESKTIGEELFEKAKIFRYAKGIGNSFNLFGNISFYSSRFLEAQHHFDSAGRYYKEAKYNKGVTVIYHNLGIIYNIIEKDSLALIYCDSLLLIENNKHTRMVSSANQIIGQIYISRGQYPLALEYFFTALEISKSLNDPSGTGSCLKNIGLSYIKLNEYEKALVEFKSALKILIEVEHVADVGNTYNYLGEIFSELDQFDSAIFYYGKGLEIAIGSKNEYETGSAYYGIGKAFLTLDKSKSLNYLQKAEKNFNSIGSKLELAKTYLLMGQFFRQEMLLDSAESALNKAMILSKSSNNPSLIAASSKELSDLKLSQKRTDEAISYLLLYNSLRDSIQKGNEEKIANYLQYKYESLREKDSLNLLQLKNQLLFQREKEELKANQRLIFFFLLFATFIIVILSIFYNNKRKNERKLAISNKIIGDQKDRMKSILETVSEGILEIDSLGKILYTNSKSSNILARNDEELIGNQLEEIFRLPDSTQKADLLRLKTETQQRILDYDHPANGVRTISLSISSINKDKRIISFSDVTEARDLEIQDRWRFINSQELEKSKIAYDLHESIAQKLHASAFQLTRVKNQDLPGVTVDVSKAILTEVINEVRDLAKSISPSEIFHGLSDAINEIVDTMNESVIVPKITLEENLENRRFEPSFELAVFRIVQELVHNGLKHAQAINIKLTVEFQEPDRLMVGYYDDGIGFDLNEKTNSSGLRILKDRAKANKGYLVIESALSEGTRVQIDFTSSPLIDKYPEQ